jgi:hypothetical protein
MKRIGIIACCMLLAFAIVRASVGHSRSARCTAQHQHKAEGTSSVTNARSESTASASSSAVDGLSANWLLAKQSNRQKETMEALTEAKERGEMEAFKRILGLRSAELARIIDEVNTGSYTIRDKQKMLIPLEMERDWADASLTALSQ